MRKILKTHRKKEAFSWDLLPRYIFCSIIWIVVAVWCLTYMYFLLWSLRFSFKTPTDSYFKVLNFSGEFYYQNYVAAFKAMRVRVGTRYAYMPELMWNSFLYCAGNAFFCNVTMVLATYLVVHYKHVPISKVLWTCFIITNFVPLNPNEGAEIKMLRELGLFGTMWGNWIYNCGAFGAGFLLMVGVWRSIGRELCEAAEIDGAGPWRIFFSIMWPMISAFFLFRFISQFRALWDDYMPMLFYLRNYPTVALAAISFQNSTDAGAADITAKAAGAFTYSIPMVLLFLLMKNKMIESMSMVGGLKG